MHVLCGRFSLFKADVVLVERLILQQGDSTAALVEAVPLEVPAPLEVSAPFEAPTHVEATALWVVLAAPFVSALVRVEAPSDSALRAFTSATLVSAATAKTSVAATLAASATFAAAATFVLVSMAVLISTAAAAPALNPRQLDILVFLQLGCSAACVRSAAPVAFGSSSSTAVLYISAAAETLLPAAAVTFIPVSMAVLISSIVVAPALNPRHLDSLVFLQLGCSAARERSAAPVAFSSSCALSGSS